MVWSGLVLVGALAVVTAALKYHRKNTMVVFLLIWLVVMNALQFFYAPGIERFRLLFLPVALILLLEVGFPARVLAGLALLSFAVNFYCIFRIQRNPENNSSLVRARWVGEQIKSSDFFLFAGTGDGSIVNVYMAYFAPHIPARSLQGYLYVNPAASLQTLDEYR
jgi:hypothetical protein